MTNQHSMTPISVIFTMSKNKIQPPAGPAPTLRLVQDSCSTTPLITILLIGYCLPTALSQIVGSSYPLEFMIIRFPLLLAPLGYALTLSIP
jgi:hypothetical protein